MINVDKILLTGELDQNSLIEILYEIADNLDSINDINHLQESNNEEIDLSYAVSEDIDGASFIEVANEILDTTSVFINADTFVSSIYQSVPVSPTFINKIEGKRIYFSNAFDLNNYSKIYITYKY